MSDDRDALVRVERAATRASSSMHIHLSRGLTSLATISSTATLIGLLGTTTQLITHTFYSCGGSPSSCLFPIAGHVSDAVLLSALGLLVSLLAFSFHRYLTGELQNLDIDMKSAQVELVLALRRCARLSSNNLFR